MKLIPTGIENFKEMIDKNAYYVDKTNLIIDVLNEQVVLNMFSTKQEVLSPAPCMAPLATMEAPNMGSAQPSMRKT